MHLSDAVHRRKTSRRVRRGVVTAIVAILPFVCILEATPSSGQQDVKPNPQTSASPIAAGTKASAAKDAKPGEFYSKELDVHFNYPVEMRMLDADAEMERGHLNIYGSPGSNDPEHMEAKRCIRFLLDAELPEDKAPQRMANLDGVWEDYSKEYKESRKPEPISANIFVTEIVRECLPKELQNNEDDVLRSIATSIVSQPGIEPMPKPIWYEVGKQKMHMNSGAGRPTVDGHPASAPIVIMSMTTQWRGHLLAWVFTSNDTEIFNQITKSQVQFGDGSWGPMFAPNIGPKGSGTPISILPK